MPALHIRRSFGSAAKEKRIDLKNPARILLHVLVTLLLGFDTIESAKYKLRILLAFKRTQEKQEVIRRDKT